MQQPTDKGYGDINHRCYNMLDRFLRGMTVALGIRSYHQLFFVGGQFMTTIRFLCKATCLCVLAVLLVSCGETRTYSSIEPGSQSARSGSRLELPPDLVDTTGDSLATNQSGQNTQAEEVLPETEEFNVTRNDQEGWLEVDAPADQVWRKLVGYWGSLGVDLIVSDPKTGTMVTDWVKPGKSKQDNQGFGGTLLSQIMGTALGGPTSLDKYTVTLERRGESRTRIHVSHTGRKKIQTQISSVLTSAEYEWVETDEDPEKVRRAMTSIVYGLESSS